MYTATLTIREVHLAALLIVAQVAHYRKSDYGIDFEHKKGAEHIHVQPPNSLVISVDYAGVKKLYTCIKPAKAVSKVWNALGD